MGLETIMETVNSELFGVWFLIGAVLVFFMQCGFAMVETGFTRAKNAGNIIMKNLMDFCIGTVMFILLGYGLMCGQDYIAGVIGLPNLGIFTHYNDFNWSNFVFNLVFCATAATIVSGAMAERTKFSAYCIYSAVISAVVYPIEAGWVWNVDGNGWLQKLGFHDYAGSCAIHNLTAMALGVFILWFAWYGFNGAAATDVPTLASILVTTTVAPAVATCTTMLFTWIKDGKPDVSMSLNGSLAGLVAVTASCDVTDALGSGIIGAVAGILVVLVVELLDKKLHIDDPVGAVAVHMANGIWGTLAVGLFTTDKAPGYAVSGLTHTGLFYGGGLHLLGTQLIGFAAVAGWAAVTLTITFFILNKTVGLRVGAEEEIKGLDATEHNLPSAYADFMPVGGFAAVPVTESGLPAAPVEKAVPVETYTTKPDAKLSEVVMLFNPAKLERVKDAMNAVGVTGMTVTNVMGCGTQKGHVRKYRGVEIEELNLNPKMKLEMVISAVPVETVIAAAREALYTGNIGDGKIFVYDVEDAVKVRTGARGYDALQGTDD